MNLTVMNRIVSVVSLILWAAVASAAAAAHFDIPAQPAATGIAQLAQQAGLQIMAAATELDNERTNAVQGEMSPNRALDELLKNTHLHVRSNDGRTILIAQNQPVQAQSAPPTGSEALRQTDAATVPGPPSAQQVDDIGEITVSASRITARGFTAPTPTTQIGAEDLAKMAQPNIFDAITQLPSLQGSTGVTTGTSGTSGGTNGLSSFNLRGLGTIRTLTLLDSQRVVPANVTGVPDISQFPQLLIKRVDVVTGGASADYGSDAVGGVVNFITDKKFEGFKANVLGGLSTYGDDANYTIQMAAGTRLFGGRGHIETSVEYSKENGVGPNGFGAGLGPNGRTYFQAPSLQKVANPLPGAPQYISILNGQDYQFAKYGLITSGPLQGTSFGLNGAPSPFLYGSGGIPTGTGAVTNCINPFCVGGDQSGTVGNGSSYASSLERGDIYTRLSFDLTPRNEVYATVNIASALSSSTPNPGAFKNGNLNILCANPYVPASVQADCTTAGIVSFAYGTSNAEIPDVIDVEPRRKQYRFVLGTDGSFDLFDKVWSYDSYFEYGENDTDLQVSNITLTPRYNAAIGNYSASVAGSGIPCGTAAAIASGCVPLNVIGNVAPSAAALAYIEPTNGPYQHTRQHEEAFSASLNGQPFSDWAGPVAFATGIDFRKEDYIVNADPYGNGATASEPYNAAYPADPVLNAAGNNWYAGNFHDGRGDYHVYEVFGETGVPLWDSPLFGKMTLDLAGRATDYSTSGNAKAWKLGGTYDTPINGIRLRAVQSRDVRAPNLSELFAAPIVTNNTVINDKTNTSVTILNEAIGNTQLKPENALTTEFGIVLLDPTWMPDWLRGFHASVDYYRTKVKDLISTLTAQNIVDLCYQGQTALCGNVNLAGTPGNPNYVVVQAFNVASVYTDGIDLESSYQFDLQHWQVPGNFTLRALATYTDNFITNTGLPGSSPIQSAGNLSGANASSIVAGSSAAGNSTPKWKLLGVEAWSSEKWNVSLTQRWFSDGKFNVMAIQCNTNCPASTATHPTISNNVMKGAFYLDIGGGYNLDSKMQVYFKIDNVNNAAPAPDPNSIPNNYGFNPALYDVIGRMYRLGFRYNY
jgi:iron complex outermembrane receptor protein